MPTNRYVIRPRKQVFIQASSSTASTPAASTSAEPSSSTPMDPAARKQKAKEAEEVMNKGLEFFNGLFKMSTGSDSGLEDKCMKIDPETGEVEMKFKIPGF